MLIESGMHLIECNAGRTYLHLHYDQEIHLFDPNVNVLNVVSHTNKPCRLLTKSFVLD